MRAEIRGLAIVFTTALVFAPIVLIFSASHFYIAAFGVLALFVSLVASTAFLSTTSVAYRSAV